MIDERLSYIDFESINDEIGEITEYIKADDYDGALEILEELMEKTENIYKEDENERFFCFDSPIQFYLYDMKFSPKKMIKRCDIDYRTLHLCKAHINMAYENYELAEESLKEALLWNPVDPNIFFELSKLFVRTNSISKLLIVLKAVRSYILDKVSHSKYFAYMGEYYRLKGDVKTALALYYMSESICETNIAKEGIELILKENEIINPPVSEEIMETLKKDGLEYSLDNEVLGMIYDLSYELSKNLNNKHAIYCLDVLYELTNDEKYLREKEYLE